MQVVHLGTEDFVEGTAFSDENPPIEKDLREYFNSGDEVKNLLQAAVSRAKTVGIKCEYQ